MSALSLSNNLYAHCLGLTSLSLYSEFPDMDVPRNVEFEGANPYKMEGAGMGGRHHYIDLTGNGFFDTLKSIGRRVFQIVSPHLVNAGRDLLTKGFEQATQKSAPEGQGMRRRRLMQ